MNHLLSMPSRPGSANNCGPRLKVKIVSSLAVLLALAVMGQGAVSRIAAAEEGVVLAIIYDTSGSMAENVPDQSGRPTPKNIIANRALVAVARQIQAFATNSADGKPRQIQMALLTFKGDQAAVSIPLSPFDATGLERWAAQAPKPNGTTPLGNTLTTAGQLVLNSPLSRKHILVITDGANTSGPEPANVLPGLKKQSAAKDTSISVHFVAFDVAAKKFDPLKKLGVTVVGASDEKQLNAQLEFILQNKILLENEELPKPK
jgi:hypothetical protein